MQKPLRRLGKFLQTVLTAFLAVLLVCNLYLFLAGWLADDMQPTVLGYSWMIVVSGSMEPELKVNDMIITHEENSYKTGEIITFQSGKSLVTHRIAGETPEGFVTKGDSNNTPDREKVSLEKIIGKVVFRIPGAGVIIGYLKTPLGMLCLVLAGFLLIELPGFLRKQKCSQAEEE